MPRRVAVAASGGRDSTALLHCTARAAAELGLEVHALHVHHGLVAEADDWLHRVRTQARRWGAAFDAHRLAGAPASGESVEAWARRERYKALGAMARDAGCDLVLLAHHRRDQAETLLLQALRGGGPAGLAAMPRHAQRSDLVWARPWLDLPRSAIEAYLQRHRLRWVDDGSNADWRFARNRLRGAVWPALEAAFTDAEPQLAAAARRAAEAAACLAEVAAADAATNIDAMGRLVLERWQALSDARRTLLLRHWLRDAPESLVQRLAAELPGRRSGRWPAPGGDLRLHDGCLSRAVTAVPILEGPPRHVDLSRPGRVPLDGWQGGLHVQRVMSGGVAPERLRRARIAARGGGEDFQAAAGATPRSLKKQFQAQRIAAWDRAGPLVWDGDSLLFVPGLGMDARALAPAGAPQLALRWEPAAAG